MTEAVISAVLEAKARRLIAEAKRRDPIFTGRKPSGLRAAAVYICAIVMGHKLTQRQLSMHYNVSEFTIRRNYQDMLDLFKDDADLT